MAPPTKQIARLQSDQILDDPQVATRIQLKDLAATRALNLLWAEPAATDRDLTLRDPGADDFVVSESLAQTLANKTLTTPTITDFTNATHSHASAAQGGTIAHADIGTPDATDDHTQYARVAGRAGGQTLVGGTAAGEDLTLESTSDGTKGTIIALDDIAMSGSEVTGLPAIPSGSTAAASKAYVDAALAGGASWKEVLLTVSQLDSVNNGINQAGAFYLANTAQIGDTFTIDDGATSETWTYAGASAPNAPAIGASALDSMTDLVSRINTDSTKWAAALATALQGINATGNVVIVYRAVPLASTTDRIYGVFATPADAQFVDYGGALDYRGSTTANLPAADPTTANFGFGRILAGLAPNDAHQVRNEDDAYTWNEDATTWQLGGSAVVLATSGSGGGIVGQVTFDSDKGLVVAGGIAEVVVGTSGAGGATSGRVTADSDKGVAIVGGVLETKVDGVTIIHNGSGQLESVVSTIQEFYLPHGGFNIISGTVVGDIGYPVFAGDFETYYEMASTTAAARIDVAFSGRLATGLTQITSIKIPYIGNAGAQYQIKVYVEGPSPSTPAYDSGLTAALTSRTLISLTDSDLSKQPTVEGRFHVVVEATLDNTETLKVGRPFVRTTA